MKRAFCAVLILAAVGCQRFSPDGVDNTSTGVIGGIPVADARIAAAIVRVRLAGDGICTGAYIGNGKILTAAHCVYGQTVLGADFAMAPSPLGCKVIKQISNPRYGASQTAEFDVAVLTTNCSSEDLSGITPFVLASSPSDAPMIGAGYGAQSIRGTDTFSSENDLSSRTLAAFSGGTLDIPPDDRAALAAGRTVCFNATAGNSMYFGDSGGPAYYVNAMGAAVVYGVWSFIVPHDNDMTGNCASRVDVNHAWIEAQ